MTTLVEPGMVKPGLVTTEQLASLRSVFVGMIADFPFLPADPWWLPCFGQTLLVADYPALAAKLGAVGLTFEAPDYRGRVRAGLDNMGGTSANRLTNQTGGLNGDVIGATGGAETHTLQISQIPEHAHGGNAQAGGAFSPRLRSEASPTSITTNVNGQFLLGSNTDGDYYDAVIESIPAHTHPISAEGGGQAHNNVQPTIIAVTCILAY